LFLFGSFTKKITVKIVTLTLNPALDKSTTTLRLIPEQKLRCTGMKTDAGGGGINVSKGIRKLGGESLAVFPAGGVNGTLLTDILGREGIDTSVVVAGSETRENISVTETDTNQQFRFTLPGMILSLEDAGKCLKAIENARPDILVASGSLPPGIPVNYYEQVAVFAKRIGARLVLDTSGEALLAAADEGLYLLKPNLAELSALLGVSQLEMDEVDEAARLIIEKGQCEIVVVSLGAQGAMLVTRDCVKHIPAPPVKKQTTVGAGDSMVAGMVWTMSQGKNPIEMVQMGVACGSAATLNRGTDLFDKAEAERLLKWIVSRN